MQQHCPRGAGFLARSGLHSHGSSRDTCGLFHNPKPAAGEKALDPGHYPVAPFALGLYKNLTEDDQCLGWSPASASATFV